MSISTFFGIQTSLRGLLAQQRASTSRRTTSPTRAPRLHPPGGAAWRRRGLELAAGGWPTAAARMLGTGVDVQSYRRVRDRSWTSSTARQNMQLGDQTARSDALLERRALVRRAGRQRHPARARRVLGLLADALERARGRRRQAAPSSTSAAALAERISDLDSAARASARQAAATSTPRSPAAQRPDPPDRDQRSLQPQRARSARADRRRPPAERPARPAATCCSTSCPSYGQVSMTRSAGDGSSTSPRRRRRSSLVDDTTGVAGHRPATTPDLTPRPAASSARCSTSRSRPARSPSYRTDLDAVASPTLVVNSVNTPPPARRLLHVRHDRADGRRGSPSSSPP